MRLLQKLRTDKNLTQESLGYRARLDKSYISKAENYGNHLGDDQLRRLAEALNWTGDPAALLMEADEALRGVAM